MDHSQVLEAALEHADLAIAEWLVCKAGYSLPAGGPADWGWGTLLLAAVRSPDGLEKLAWLRERGAPPPPGYLVCGAVRAGQIGVASFLLQLPGAASELHQQQTRLVPEVVASRNIPMMEFLWDAGVRFTHEAFRDVAGSLPMVRWLVQHMDVPAVGLALHLLIVSWPRDTPAHSRDLLEATQLLVEKAGHCVPPVDYKAALTAAATRGDLALVQYLLLQQRAVSRSGYQPDGELVTAAAEGGCEALLEWLAEQHPSCLTVAGIRYTPYEVAAKRGDRSTLEALRRLGVPWGTDEMVLRAVWAQCPFQALRWLVEQGAPVGSASDMSRAVARGLERKHLSAEEAAWLRGLALAGAA